MKESWSSNIENWRKLPEIYLNGNWKQTKVSSSDTPGVSKKGGIYMYCIQVPKAKNEKIKSLNTPIYMGISNNLRRRFKEHLDKDDPIYPYWKCFGSNMNFFYLVVEPYRADEIKDLLEQPMFDCFGKVVNKIDSVARGKPIRGTIKKFKPI